MKQLIFKITFLGLIVLYTHSSIAATRFWIGAVDNNWSTVGNWGASSGVADGNPAPGPADEARFDNLGLANCNLDVDVTIMSLRILASYTGTIDMNTRNLIVTNVSSMISGTINNTGGTNWLTFTGNFRVTFGGTEFGAKVRTTAGHPKFDGSVFNDSVSVTKSNNQIASSKGNNVFNSTFEFINNTSVAVLMCAQAGSTDLFNGDVLLGGDPDGAGGSLGGITFSTHATSTTIMAAGTNLGESASVPLQGGRIVLQRFNLLSVNPVVLHTSGQTGVYFGPSSTFNGPIDMKIAGLFFNGGRFKENVKVEKNNTIVTNAGIGGNVFEKDLHIVINHASAFTTEVSFGTSAPDSLFGDFILGGPISGISHAITLGKTVSGPFYMAPGARILSDPVDQWGNNVDLDLRYFTQDGNARNEINAVGTSSIHFGMNTTIGGVIEAYVGYYHLNGALFMDSAMLTCEAQGSTVSDGGNTFMSYARLAHSRLGGIQSVTLANVNGDLFMGDLELISGYPNNQIIVAKNKTTTIKGNIGIRDDAFFDVSFSTGGTGTVLLDGPALQRIYTMGVCSFDPPRFRKLIVANPNTVHLGKNIAITDTLDLSLGQMRSFTDSMLIINDNAIVVNQSDASFVRGRMAKVGNDDFNFPVGDNNDLQTISMSNGIGKSVTDRFEAEYFNVNPDLATPLPFFLTLKEASLTNISSCEHWILDREVGAAQYFVTLSWDALNCQVTDPNDLLVARWEKTFPEWKNHGNGGVTGNISNGTIMTSARTDNYGPFTLASSLGINPLPVELIYFTATPNERTVELNWSTSSETNSDYFVVQRTSNEIDYEEVGKVNAAGTSSSILDYSLTDISPKTGISYYRLIQKDKDGNENYSSIVPVKFSNSNELEMQIIPNPVRSGEAIFLLSNIEFNENDYLSVYSETGKIIQTIRLSNAQISKDKLFPLNQTLNPGLYFINLFNQNGYNLTKKFIVH